MEADTEVPSDLGNYPHFERALPESCMEYMLFVIDSQLDPRRSLSALEAVRKAALQLSDKLTKEYIWHRDSFNLESKSQDGTLLP